MGFLKHLLFWPVTGPLFLTRFSFEKVEDAARDELTDDTRIREELTALQLQLELGEIDDEEFERREAGLMRRLREAREWRRRFGMGVRGGPVRVAGEQAKAEVSVDVDVADDADDDAGEEDGEDEWSPDSRDGSSGGSTPGSSSS